MLRTSGAQSFGFFQNSDYPVRVSQRFKSVYFVQQLHPFLFSFQSRQTFLFAVPLADLTQNHKEIEVGGFTEIGKTFIPPEQFFSGVEQLL